VQRHQRSIGPGQADGCTDGVAGVDATAVQLSLQNLAAPHVDPNSANSAAILDIEHPPGDPRAGVLIVQSAGI